MEESDAMLIASIKQHIKISDDISTLKDIRTENIYQIACCVFDLLKIDYEELKQINKAQRFRSMTKLTQTINSEMDTTFDLNDIMNPTLPFLRKLLLAFISKLGAAEGQRNKALINQNTQGNEIKYQKQVLKRWLNAEFICPELRMSKKFKYQPHLLKLELKKDIFKRNLTSQISGNPGNANAVMKTAMAKETMERKKREAEEGITRKGQENDRNAYRIVKNNVEDWQKADQTIKKLKKQLLKTNQQASSKDNQQGGQMSIYQQQVEQIAEEQKKLKANESSKTETMASQIQSMQEDMSPLQKIRIQTENARVELEHKLKDILNAISEAKQHIAQKETLKQKLQDQIVLYEEKATAEREARAGIKKKVEKQKILLDTLEGDTDITKEVEELEKQVKYLEQEAEKQISGLEKQIESSKAEGEEKLQILKDLKLRLNKIQTDYGKICEEIEDKNQIKGKVKVSKSGISRLYYSKKISEMEVRWRETQKQSKKILQNVSKIRQEIRRTLSFAQIAQTQIDNCSNSSKLRTQAENTSFKQIFNQCKKTFNQTIKCIEQINETKNEIQEYEMKVHTLAGKDYKENTKKLQIALEQLKKQIKEISNKK